MSNHQVISAIVGFLALSKATIISQKYTLKLEFNDKISNSEFLGDYNAYSLAECAAMCRQDCAFFGFNYQLRNCRTHKNRLTSGMTNEAGWRYYSDNNFSDVPKDCKELLENGQKITGVYDIYPTGTLTVPVHVYCDMLTMGGGWTVIQKRVDKNWSFERNWMDYKNGFGVPERNIWVGNDVIHLLTKGKNSSLYVSITVQNGTTLYETYGEFSVSDEAGKYQLFLAGPANGTLGDSMLDSGLAANDLSGMYFSTRDRDNDGWGGFDCAGYYKGGWWFNGCHYAFLNGPWFPGSWAWPWYPTVEDETEVRATKMMIRQH